ncbi:hypothetical protein [Acetobacter thailandicus]|uniref:hypothetical protein n=1 Tax=Acetobacter thailandicus TaxID=1502842 RepID=UPI001BAAC4EF|nr:hypothetical protein [Acetobacter thailandicus]MBS0959786.1 hypothetical protein [Acetobacter thailandicus]
MALPTSSRSGSTVTVICRMPSGLVLDLYDEGDLAARAQAKNTVMLPPVPKESITLRGARRDPRYHKKENIMLGMGGRTEVPSDFWTAWEKQNVNFMPLKNGLIFAMPKEADAVDKLNEFRHERTGLEGLDRDKIQGVKPMASDDD